MERLVRKAPPLRTAFFRDAAGKALSTGAVFSSTKAADATLYAGWIRALALRYNYLVKTAPHLTIVAPGAFTVSLREDAARVKLLLYHDKTKVIGRATELRESARGLEAVAVVDRTPLGEAAYLQVQSRTLTEVSVGFDIVDSYSVPAARFDEMGKHLGTPAAVIDRLKREGWDAVRVVTRARLWEISLVPWGAAGPEGARIEEVYRLERERYRAMSTREKLAELRLAAAEMGIIPASELTVEEKLASLHAAAIRMGLPIPK